MRVNPVFETTSPPYDDINPDDVSVSDSFQYQQRPDLLYMRQDSKPHTYRNIDAYAYVQKGRLVPRPFMGSKQSLTITENDLYTTEPRRYENVEDQRDSAGLFIVENEGYVSVNQNK